MTPTSKPRLGPVEAVLCVVFIVFSVYLAWVCNSLVLNFQQNEGAAMCDLAPHTCALSSRPKLVLVVGADQAAPHKNACSVRVWSGCVRRGREGASERRTLCIRSCSSAHESHVRSCTQHYCCTVTLLWFFSYTLVDSLQHR
jgi:hypothetical protein